MWLVQLHSEHQSYRMIQVPVYAEVAAYMLHAATPRRGLHRLDRIGGGLDDDEVDEALDYLLEEECAQMEASLLEAASLLEDEAAFWDRPLVVIPGVASVQGASSSSASGGAAAASDVKPPAKLPIAVAEPANDAEPEGNDDGDGLDTKTDNVLSDRVRELRKLIPGATTSAASFHKHWSQSAKLVQELLTPSNSLPSQDSLTIIGATQQCATLVAQEMPAVRSDLQRLAVGALVFYRMRLCDISLREHIHILWVICGDRSLRAHNGQAYHYEATLGWRCVRTKLHDANAQRHQLRLCRSQARSVAMQFRTSRREQNLSMGFVLTHADKVLANLSGSIASVCVRGYSDVHVDA